MTFGKQQRAPAEETSDGTAMVIVCLPAQLLAAAQQTAAAERIELSQLARRAIRLYLAGHGDVQESGDGE